MEPGATQHNSGDTRWDDARSALLQGMRLSRQGSYGRRAPSPSALPQLRRAKSLLLSLVEEREDPALLRDLSLVEECLLNYEGAVKYLEQLVSTSAHPSKKDLKRLAMLRQASVEWNAIQLTPVQLRELGEYLRRLDVGPEHRTLDLTRDWMMISGVENPDAILASFAEKGAFSDFQVLENVIRG